MVKEHFNNNQRLANQPMEKVLDAYRKLESAFPVLALCNNHWKANSLLKQIVDNRLDRFPKKQGGALSVNG